MNFDFNTKTFRSLLGENLNTLHIPRFQRDYSWEKEQVTEFIEDLVNNSEENKAYFFGTILVSGNVNGTKETLEVIDGQQRITTATIFLSTIGKLLKEKKEEALAEKVWEYIIKTTDDGEKITLLENNTADDFFKEHIQDLNRSLSEIIHLTPDNYDSCPDEETKRILIAAKCCIDYLKEDNLKIKFSDNYIDNLKKMRDLLLNSTVVCISTTDKDNANLIFEILNSKGKGLEDIDLIKNEIFKIVSTKQPKDYAVSKWNEIKQHLSTRKRIDLSTFYHHFWLSTHQKVNKSDFYEQFKSEIREEQYESFLDLLVKNAERYKIICSPDPKDFSNQKEYLHIVDELDALSSFKTKQYQITLLSLFNARDKKQISFEYFSKVIIFLTRFIFMYYPLCKKKANAIGNQYAKFALDIHSASSKNEVHSKIDKNIENFMEKLPKKEEFKQAFSKLSFSKVKNEHNYLAKYAIYEIERIMQEGYNHNNKIILNTASIEHIIPEEPKGNEKKENENKATNIGNLALLELHLNNKCDNLPLAKKLPIYRESSFYTTKAFLEKHEKFDEDDIKTRADYLAELFYESMNQFKKDAKK